MKNINNIEELIDNIDDLIVIDKDMYKDESILSKDSTALKICNNFFSSITCGNKEVEQLLYEIIAYSLSKTAIFHKAIILKGIGRNGKSSFLKIVEALAGDKYCRHESLEKLFGTKVGGKSTVRLLEGATVNILEDQKQCRYINGELLSKIISGDTISDSKGDKEFHFRPYSTMLFSVNEVIDFKETGLYVTDRFICIPFLQKYTDNRNIITEYMLCQPEVLKIVATKSVKAFKEALSNGRFTIPPIVEQETKRYFMDCNNVSEFCSIYPIKEFAIKDGYFKKYCKWCNKNNLESYNNVRFGKEVLKLGYRSDRCSFGKRPTCYVNPNYNMSESIKIYNRYLTDNGISEEVTKHYDEATIMKTFGVSSFSDYLLEYLYNEKYDVGTNKNT